MSQLKFIRDKRSPMPKSTAVSKAMSSNKPKNTIPELLLRKALWQINLRGYRIHSKLIEGRPDIVYPKLKIAIFVNGCFWHRCPNCKLPLPKHNREFWKEKFNKNILRDKKVYKQLKKEGWSVLIIWECQIKSDLTKVLSGIKNAINISKT